MFRKNKPRNLAAAGVALMNSANEILLQRRKDVNLWGIPGGVLDVGESLEDCARREVFEETNLVIGHMDFHKVYSGEGMYWKYPDGNEYYLVSAVFITEDYSGELNADDDETYELRFFDFDDLPEIISTNTQIIDNIRRMRG